MPLCAKSLKLVTFPFDLLMPICALKDVFVTWDATKLSRATFSDNLHR